MIFIYSGITIWLRNRTVFVVSEPALSPTNNVYAPITSDQFHVIGAGIRASTATCATEPRSPDCH